MSDFFKKENLIIFAGGIVTGIVGLKVAKNEKTRKVIVKTLAQGMMTKDCVVEEYTNIREEADDICAEAKALAAAKVEAETAE
ncbi:MAG: DUF6110 family protein [Eubacteriales bacterium]